MLYSIYQHILDSNIPLPELFVAAKEIPHFIFRFHPFADPKIQYTDWFHHWDLPDGSRWASFAKLIQPQGYLIRFAELADYYVTKNGEQIDCYPLAKIPKQTIRHLFLDQVLPAILSHRGKLAFHAGAVAIDQGAIAFLGSSGYGKSTLTSSFAAQGFPMLSDDCLVIEEQGKQLLGIPSYPGIRLWTDSINAVFTKQLSLSQVAHYTEKKRIATHKSKLTFSSQSTLIERFYFLTAPEETLSNREVTFTPLTSRDAYMELLKYSYHLDITDRNLLKLEFDRLSRIAQLDIFYKLSYPRDHALLPAVREAILAHLQQP